MLQPWDYRAIVPAALRTTELPLPATTAFSPAENRAYVQPRHDAAYWAAQTEGMDFSAEDRLDTPRFNRILWAGLMGDAAPFPENPQAKNLRRHRGRVLRRFTRRKDSRRGAEADPG
jgi:hypothetical protein